MLRISSEERRAVALRARAHLRPPLKGNRFEQRQHRRGRAAPRPMPVLTIDVSPAARLRRAAQNAMSEELRLQSRIIGTRAAGAPANSPHKVRSTLGGCA